MSQKENSRKKYTQQSLGKKRGSSEESSLQRDAASNSARNKTPTIMDFINKQKVAKTAECPVCNKNVPLSKMNQHLDDGCLAMESSCLVTAVDDQTPTTNTDSAASCSYEYDREIDDNDEIKKTQFVNLMEIELSPQKLPAKTKSTGVVSPYFKNKSETEIRGKRFPLKRKTCSPIFNPTNPRITENEIVDDSKNDRKNLSLLPGEASLEMSVQSETSKGSEDDIQITDEINTSDPTKSRKTFQHKVKLKNRPPLSVGGSLAQNIMATEASQELGFEEKMDFQEYSIEKKQNDESNNSCPSSSTSLSCESSSVSMTTTFLADEEEDENDSNFGEVPHQPYYLVNFSLMMNTVLNCEEDRCLFNEEDMLSIDKFKSLTIAAQMLYVRLFQRKPTWLRVSKLDYPKIAEDLKPVVHELIKQGFLQSETGLCDVDEVLKLLPAPDLKNLAKSLKVPTAGMQRKRTIEALLKHGRQQRTIFGGITSLILKRAKKALGSCIRLIRDVKAVFTRLVLLFSLSNISDEEDYYASGGQSLLSMLFLANTGKVVYPEYTVNRPTILFRSREEFLKFQTALQHESDINSALGNNEFDNALQLYLEACKDFEKLKENNDVLRFDKSLPEFLRCYTPSWIYTRILALGVEILQKLRRYRDAVEKLQELLAQETYCCHARGRWWDRLALNLDQHLKKHSQSLDVIKLALADSHVRTGHRLALEQRIYKICESPSHTKLKKRLQEFDIKKLQETPKVIISGNIQQNDVVKERFYVIKIKGENGEKEEVLTPRVEDFVLHHYKQSDYNEGVHGEGSTFTTLIGLLTWDIVFTDSVPDVFRYQFQSGPLDFRRDDFYLNRKDMIDTRLDLIKSSDIDTIHGMIDETWNAHEGEQCSLIDWTLFSNVDHVKGLAACMGGDIISSIGKRILRDHRHCRGGVPDLVVWNTENKTFRVVEVKGPNDRLAPKQILWIDYLNSVGATAEVCYVTAIGGKRKRATID